MLICRTDGYHSFRHENSWRNKTSTDGIVFSNMHVIKMSRSVIGLDLQTLVLHTTDRCWQNSGAYTDYIPAHFHDRCFQRLNPPFLFADCRAHQHRLHRLLGAVRHGKPLVDSPRQQHHPARSQPPAVHVCKELHRVQPLDLLHLQPELQKGG